MADGGGRIGGGKSGSGNGFQGLGLSDPVYHGIVRMGFRVSIVVFCANIDKVSTAFHFLM